MKSMTSKLIDKILEGATASSVLDEVKDKTPTERKQIAAEMEATAKVLDNSAAKRDIDPDLKRMYAKDAKDLRRIASLVVSGASVDKLDYAFTQLDTAAREAFPKSFIKWLGW